MRAHEFITETPLPSDWDQSVYTEKNSFKKRLDYALERASKIGTGSSRVAFVIEYEGRPTVIKVAKNAKGYAQNQAEYEIISDWYIQEMEIIIPYIDHGVDDSGNITWIQTEFAEKPKSEKQLCSLIGCLSLYDLIQYAKYGHTMYDIMFDKDGNRTQSYDEKVSMKKMSVRDLKVEELRNANIPEDKIDNFIDYADKFTELKEGWKVELADFNTKTNWGIYHGRPVVIDVGFTTSVYQSHYSR